MTDFHDVRFPMHLAFGASGGPRRTTHILQLDSGGEARNSPHRHARRQYNASAGLKSQPEAIELLDFYEARRGALYAFRFRDPLDHATSDAPASTDEVIGFGDGTQTVFQLTKSYGSDPHSYIRPITKPVAGTVQVAVNGVQTTDFIIDIMTGLITFPNAPSAGETISAGFEFDVPVRFASNGLDIILDNFGSHQIQDIPLIEVIDYV